MRQRTAGYLDLLTGQITRFYPSGVTVQRITGTGWSVERPAVLRAGHTPDGFRSRLQSLVDMPELPAGPRVIPFSGPAPSFKTLERWTFDSICKTPDGCTVEPDGRCCHGLPSWLLIAGVI